MLTIQKRLTPLFYGILSLPSSAMGFALSVQIAALSWILNTKYKLSFEDIGLVWAAGPLAGIFGQVIFGVISDRVWFWGGRRRPFILIGGVLAALSLLALPNIEVISLALGLDGLLGVAIAVALSLDISINIGFNPTRSIIADVTPEGQARTKGYTWMQTISGTLGMLAYVISAIWGNYVLIYLGALLVLLTSVLPPFFIEEPRHFGDEEAGPKISLGKMLRAIMPLWGFLLYGIYGIVSRLMSFGAWYPYMELACLALTVLLIGASLAQKEGGKSAREAGLLGFQKVLAAHAFTWLGIQSMFIYMLAFVKYRLPVLDDFQSGQVVSVSFLIFNGVAAVLPAFVLEPLTRRIGRVRTHLYCILSMAAGYAAVWALGQKPEVIYVLFAILGIGWAATVSLPFAIMSQKVDQSLMGLFMGLFNLSVVLPQLASSLAVGKYIEQSADKGVLFVICALSLAFSAFAWSLVGEDDHGRNEAPSALKPGH